MLDQPELPFGLPRQRKPVAAPAKLKDPPPPAPAPARPSWWGALGAAVAALGRGLGWIGEQVLRIRGIFLLGAALVAIAMTIAGLTYWQVEVWGYRFKVEKLVISKETPKGSGNGWNFIVIEKVTKEKQ